MNTIIEKIRAEVNKLPEKHKGLYKQFGNSLGFIDGLDMVMKILSDLEKEEKPSEGLEEEIERYLHSLGVGYGGWVDGMEDDDLRGIARHFAQWQKEKMMKEAVEGEG